jgi:hypothetical protein
MLQQVANNAIAKQSGYWLSPQSSLERGAYVLGV